MPGVTPNTLAGRLQLIQSFKETVWGTSGLATAKWMLIKPTPQFTPIYKSTLVDEDRGSFAASFVSYVPELGGNFNVNWDASFEDINFAMQGILGAVAPTGGGPYVYTYLGPLTSAWSPQTYSLELGYDVATLLAMGCITTKVSIKMNAKGNWTLDQSGFFQQLQPYAALAIASSTNVSPIAITTSSPLPAYFVTGMQVVITGHLVNTNANGTWTVIKTGASSFTLTGSTGNGIGGATGTATVGVTPAIADRTVEPILFAGETALAIDAALAAPGTTPVPNALVSATLEIDNQQQGFFTGDQKYPIDFTQDKLKVTLTLRLKWNAQVKALYQTWIAGSRSVFQIKSTSGVKSAEIDFAGVLAADPANYELDYGAITQELKFEGQYDAGTLANYLKVIITNSVSALP